MAKRTLQREIPRGKTKEYLVIADNPSLHALTFEGLEEDDLKKVAALYRMMHKLAQKWFWIETGVFPVLQVLPKKDGYMWMVPDTRSNSLKYRWLSGKAENFTNKIISRLSVKFADELVAAVKIVTEDKQDGTVTNSG